MFSSKHAGGANGNAKKPMIRRETVRVPVKPQTSNGVQKPASTVARPPANRFKLSDRPGAKTSPAAKKSQAPVQRVAKESRALKRKSMTPERVQFSSDDESDSSASDSEASRKRMKSSVSSVESTGPRRNLVLNAAFGSESEPLSFLNGADATSGEYATKFNNAFYQEEFATLKLQYPTNSPRERFELKWPKNENEDYKPMTDITETVKTITSFYFPEELREKYLNEETGWERRFNRAWQRQDVHEFVSIVKEYNDVLKRLADQGSTRRELASKRQIPLDIVKRILDQIYSRTVSPKVETLKAYQNGGDNVYGELLYRFCSNIFKQTKMTQDHVFVDLGSGVGNVVLQAALEVGCESWGIEQMKNPCNLAELQAKEFPGRTHLWGIDVGSVHLIRGDFTNNSETSEVLQRADIVLVNNQAFHACAPMTSSSQCSWTSRMGVKSSVSNPSCRKDIRFRCVILDPSLISLSKRDLSTSLRV